MKNEDFKSNRHSIYNLKYHLVVVTKYRHKCITEEMLNDLEEIFKKNIEKNNGSLIEFNGEKDHVHLLFEIPPQIELAKLINNLKTVSSRLIRKKYSEYLKQFYWKNVFWSRSYCILTTGRATIEMVEKYIQSQVGVKD
ncbi:IS200/IS605 family transposase [uncultured Fusobacterium sp.]|uniref:IS200/IS605 family transposase n=1 Tax=uncultured Fusobacterium sp. TaxID=159267 RepID=UPI0025DF780E|nr:IS200/IS605 family transposase [uncultured Fusobacterium sp.]